MSKIEKIKIGNTDIYCEEREDLKKTSLENLIDGMEIWCEFWRKNIEIFVEQYFGLKLYTFQKILIHMMHISDFFCWIACRGLGKSYLTAIYCCAIAVLYPGVKIVIASGNKRQAGAVITEKIADLMHDSPTLANEIEPRGIRTFHDNVSCVFKNGSKIMAVTSSQGSRGVRANIILLDEFRMIDKTILDQVLKPFLTNKRTPPFYKNSNEYKNYPKENNKEIYLSSAWLKSHWSWDKFGDITKMMLEGKSACSFDIGYECSLDHDLISQEKIDEDKISLGEFSFGMEYEGRFFGENENSFYKSAEINQCRVLQNPFYPLADDEYRNEDIRKKRLKQMPRKKGEIRILSVDVAVSKSNNNDNSVYTLMRLLENGNSYVREVVYIESHNGMKMESQAIRIKRLDYEFNADKIIIDAQGVGYPLIEEMERSHYDKTIDMHFEPIGVYASNANSDFEPLRNGNNKIFMMKAFERDNNNVAVYLKNAFTSKKIRLLIDENSKRDDFNSDKRFHEDGVYAANKLLPFVQTSQLVFETLNLEYEVKPSGNIAIKEKGRNRKDRFSSTAYANYLAQLIEDEEYKKKNKKKGGFMFFT